MEYAWCGLNLEEMDGVDCSKKECILSEKKNPVTMIVENSI